MLYSLLVSYMRSRVKNTRFNVVLFELLFVFTEEEIFRIVLGGRHPIPAQEMDNPIY